MLVYGARRKEVKEGERLKTGMKNGARHREAACLPQHAQGCAPSIF